MERRKPKAPDDVYQVGYFIVEPINSSKDD